MGSIRVSDGMWVDDEWVAEPPDPKSLADIEDDMERYKKLDEEDEEDDD